MIPGIILARIEGLGLAAFFVWSVWTIAANFQKMIEKKARDAYGRFEGGKQDFFLLKDGREIPVSGFFGLFILTVFLNIVAWFAPLP